MSQDGAASGGAEPIIVARSLAKEYRTRQHGSVTALARMDFSIADGEFVCVVGPSGCGKSTLLNILAGLIRPSAGRVTLRGTPITGPRRDIGVVFQNPVLLEWRTVLENTLLPIQVHRLRAEDYLPRARQLIDVVGLSEFADRYPFELSGGMQQRNSIVRALVHDPAILLMDEPFGALDALTREQMHLLIQDIWLAARKTVFFITHSIPEAVFLADRVLVMSPRPGRLVEVIGVDLPRPRSLDLTTTDEFGAYVRRIRHLLGIESGEPAATVATGF